MPIERGRSSVHREKDKAGGSPQVERDYLERTIATVRNHRDAENCWPQWANIFADEIERLWRIEDAARAFMHDNDDLPFDCGRDIQRRAAKKLALRAALQENDG